MICENTVVASGGSHRPPATATLHHMSALFYTQIDDSPVGPLLLAGDHDALHVLAFGAGCRPREIDASWQPDTKGVLKHVRKELDEYFAGRLKQISTPVAFGGTPFQNSVWQELQRIPYGETISYLELAKRIDNQKAVRAVGMANGANPIGVAVPCHRVIGADGSLTGYGGGLERKRWLLAHEGAELN